MGDAFETYMRNNNVKYRLSLNAIDTQEKDNE